MANRMSVAQSRLAVRQEDTSSEPVTYTVAANSATFPIEEAIRGRHTPQRAALADGRVDFEVEPQDWLIRPELIDYGAGPHEPKRGDRITDADGIIYEVVPQRDGEPGVRRSDQFGHLRRIRTIVWNRVT